jgi:hypothetical protein
MSGRRRLWIWKHRRAVMALSAAFAVVLLRLPSLNLLLDRDEGEYATLAWLWRSGAGLPYRDWLEQKPPLAIAMNALAQVFCADGVLGLRLLSLAWTTATVLALFFLVDLMAGRGRMGSSLRRRPRFRAAAAGLAALVAAFLLSTSRTQSLAANTETWQTLPLLGALAVLFAPDPAELRWRHYLAAGCFIGISSLFKQTALAAVLLLPWAAQDRDGRPLKCVFWTLLGALLPWTLAWGVFEAKGAGPDFLRCTLAYNRTYVLQGVSGAWSRAAGLALRLAPETWALACLAALGWRTLGRGHAPRRWLAAWLVVGLLAAAASGRFYPHYAILLLPPLAVLAGVGLLGLVPNAPGWSPGWAPRVLRGALAVTALCGYLWADGGLWLRPSAAARTRHVYGLETFVNAPAAAARLRALCPPSENLFIWGDEAELYYLAQRRPATRFLFTYPFTGEAPPWPDGEQEMLTGLQDYNTGAAVLCKGLDKDDPFQKSVLDGLSEQFTPDTSVPGFLLGARRR